jgi:hypothetical protein
MKLFDGAKQLLVELQVTQHFLEKATLKARVLRQGATPPMALAERSSPSASVQG